MTPLLVALSIGAPIETQLAPLRSWRAEDAEVLREHGAVVLDGGEYDPIHAYALINREDLPVLITLDSLYWALGLSHVAIVWAVEHHYQRPDAEYLVRSLFTAGLGLRPDDKWLEVLTDYDGMSPKGRSPKPFPDLAELSIAASQTAKRSVERPQKLGVWPPPKVRAIEMPDLPAGEWVPPPSDGVGGYVEPRPDAFIRLIAYAQVGLALVPQLDPDGLLGLERHFERSLAHYETLWRLATLAVDDAPFDASQRVFLDDTVDHIDLPDDSMGANHYGGWFMDLLFEGARRVHARREQSDEVGTERTLWLVARVGHGRAARIAVGPVTIGSADEETWLHHLGPWFDRKPKPWPTTRFDLTVDEVRHDLVIKVEASADIGPVTLELAESGGRTIERTLHVDGQHELRVHLPDDEGCCRAHMQYLTIHRGPDRWRINDDHDHLIPVPVRVDFDATGVLITRADGETMRAQ